LQHSADFDTRPDGSPPVSELLNDVQHLVSRQFAQHVVDVVPSHPQVQFSRFGQGLDLCLVRPLNLLLKLRLKVVSVFINLVDHLYSWFLDIASTGNNVFNMAEHAL
jgi:hypothetical protein